MTIALPGSPFAYAPETSAALWGRKLTDEFCINGRCDTRNVWGHDFSVIGRSREVGVSIAFCF